MRYAILFPGQGSQHVGMGDDIISARPDLLGERATATLGWSLEEICAVGPEDELRRTDRAQPALYAISYALWEAFSAESPRPPHAAAGHSLGEYTALAASASLDYWDGLRLVAERGRAMDQATSAESGTMAAVLGADLEAVEAAVAGRRAAGGSLWVANINAPGQVVVAGAVADVDWLRENARDVGLRRVMPLNVAGAFHTPLMAAARDRLRTALDETRFQSGNFPVWANFDASPTGDPAATLAGQLVGKVRFAESLTAMRATGIEAFVHIGPGEVTAGMAKRTVPDAATIVVSSLDDIPAAVDQLALS